MAAAAQNRGGSLSVHDVLCRWAPAYLAQFGAAMPARQREVLQALLACRTPALGGALHYCPNCDHRHFSYHSCNDTGWKPPTTRSANYETNATSSATNSPAPWATNATPA